MPPKSKRFKRNKCKRTPGTTSQVFVQMKEEPIPGISGFEKDSSELLLTSKPTPIQNNATSSGGSPAPPTESERHYLWNLKHQPILAEFWMKNPIFYDKTQMDYKNRELKETLIRDLIEENRSEWEKMNHSLPTVIQVLAHLRNMRTRYVKVHKRKITSPSSVLSYTDQKIFERYHFLHPYIRKYGDLAAHNMTGLENSALEREDEAASMQDASFIDEYMNVEPDPNSTSNQEKSAYTPPPSFVTNHHLTSSLVTNHLPTPSLVINNTSTSSLKTNQPPTSPLVTNHPSTSSHVTNHGGMSEIQIIQQAKDLISYIKTPDKGEGDTRVRDFSRYMESELRRVPESAWDDCTLTIMTVIRSFKTGQVPSLPTT